MLLFVEPVNEAAFPPIFSTFENEILFEVPTPGG